MQGTGVDPLSVHNRTGTNHRAHLSPSQGAWFAPEALRKLGEGTTPAIFQTHNLRLLRVPAKAFCRESVACILARGEHILGLPGFESD